MPVICKGLADAAVCPKHHDMQFNSIDFTLGRMQKGSRVRQGAGEVVVLQAERCERVEGAPGVWQGSCMGASMWRHDT